MRKDEEQAFSHSVSLKPPQGLFSRIMRRLGLERQLRIVKNNLGLFSVLLATFLVLSFFAFIGLKHVLAESSFGPFLSLILSDPGIVLKYWHSFALSVLESVPGAYIALFLIPLALLLLFVRLVGARIEKFLLIMRSIHKHNHGYK